MDISYRSIRSAACALLLTLAAAAAHGADACRAWASSEAAAYRSSTLTAADGTCLRWFSWLPRDAKPKGVLVITHGIRDHALRYDGFAQRLTARGYAVFAYDLRGHGHSGGPRQRFDSINQLVGDKDQIVAIAGQQIPDVPIYLYGHSLGGLVTTAYLVEHPAVPRGVVLSGAAFERPASVGGFSVFLARIVAAIAPGFNAVAVDDREFSRDPATMSAMAADPLIVRDKLPAISAVASIDGMRSVREQSAGISVPLLVMYGTDDKVNPIEGSRAFIGSVRSSDKTLKEYKGLYHDMLHEPEHEQVEDDVMAWLDAH